MSTLQHLGGKTWRIRVDVGHDAAGRRRRVSRSFTANGIRAAKRKAVTIEAAIRAEADEAAKAEGTIAWLVDDWLERAAVLRSPSTMPAYKRHGKRIKAKFGPMNARDLTPELVDAWYVELQRGGMSAANIRHVHRVLSAVLTYGKRTKRVVSEVVTADVDAPRHDVDVAPPPDPATMKRLLAHLPDDAEWARAIWLLVLTGVRRGEVVGLRWDGWTDGRLVVQHSVVEVKGERVHVQPFPKGRKPRTIDIDPLADAVLDQQRRWLARHGVVSPWVFPDWRTDATGDTPRRPGWLSLMWGRHRTKCGAPKVRLHDLRHYYATQALARGVDLASVSGQLGHAKVSTTSDIYTHGTAEGGRAAAAAVAASVRDEGDTE